MAKRIHTFRRGTAERTADASESLGAKGANLALLASLDLPVPPGFTVTSSAWREASTHADGLPQPLRSEVSAAVAWLEETTGRSFDGAERPLLLAVRTSSRTGIPGLAETVLDVGMNDRTVETLSAELADQDFAFRSYRRFIEAFSGLVYSVDAGDFEDMADEERAASGWAGAEPTSAAEWRALIARYLAFIEDEIGETMPQTPIEQLFKVIEASFQSWRNPVARSFRLAQGIAENAGLAVTAHAMIFNERDQNSGSGTALSRDLKTGQSRLTGEFGLGGRERAVIGEREERMALETLFDGALHATGQAFPSDIAALADHVRRLEAHVGDAVEVDFMVGDSELFLLQSRIAKRTAGEAIRVVVELVKEGLIEEEEALLRIDPASLDKLLHPTIVRDTDLRIVAKGLPASPGAATGEIVFTAERAQELASEGRPVILVRNETHPEDIHGMHVSEGVLTVRGGTTSHAAVVARGIGKPCVTGAGSLRIDADAGELRVNGTVLKVGDQITIDGSTGEVIEGSVELKRPALTGDFATLMEFADRARRMGVRTNAETPIEARAARAFGAEGIGLCRTEHMFFEGDRIRAMREMILAPDEVGRRAALEQLLPIQRSDFV
ncbi:MAG: pyruvate, phosphate dikinase, partial [Rhizobiaceae bacterium]|nr:pyruvate, phosphate dikinase [Rhizobiaceae bacterium]